MVVQYLFCDNYVPEKRIRLPRRMNEETRGYEIEGDLVRFFSCDERDSREIVLNRWIVPEEAKYIEFSKMDFHGEIYPGAPKYYDNKGNLLKMGNR